MTINTTCECGHVLRVRDEFEGKLVRCPSCQQAVLITPDPEVEDDEEFVEETFDPSVAADFSPPAALVSPNLPQEHAEPTSFHDSQTRSRRKSGSRRKNKSSRDPESCLASSIFRSANR